MNNFPEFSTHHYQITQELGHNLTGGRVTYKATYLPTDNDVVIKQFQFSRIDSWKATEYDAYEQEIEVLRRLNHPGIPKYLDSFETADGFCLVQEYLNAQSLAIPRSWQLEEIKHIALSILDILVYLQSQTPSVIHRDIKPENVLIDEQLKVYLVDFGFARLGSGDVTASSMVKGTMGFMPPEQLFNRELTTASDLYGLGVTLICLLTGVKSVDIGSLIDSDYCIHFRHLIPPLQRGWISWLEKMVKPLPKERYASAIEALKALEPIDLTQLPKVRTSSNIIEFKGAKWGEKLTETITVANPIPDTILSGTWEVAPHSSDPPHTPYEHSWIKIEPSKFASNSEQCKFIVDTSKLLENTVYERQLLLHTNSSVETYPVQIKVHTGSLPKLQNPNYLTLGILFIISLLMSFLLLYYWIIVKQYFWDFDYLFGDLTFLEVSMFLFISTTVAISIDRFFMLPQSQTKNLWHLMLNIFISIIFLLLFAFFIIAFFYSSYVALSSFNLHNNITFLISIAGIITSLIIFLKYGFYINIPVKSSFIAVVIFVSLLLLPLTIIAILILGPSFILWQILKAFAETQIDRNIPQREAGILTLTTVGLAISLSTWIVIASQIMINNNSVFLFSQLGLLTFVGIISVLTLSILLSRQLRQCYRNNQFIYQYNNQKKCLILP